MKSPAFALSCLAACVGTTSASLRPVDVIAALKAEIDINIRLGDATNDGLIINDDPPTTTTLTPTATAEALVCTDEVANECVARCESLFGTAWNKNPAYYCAKGCIGNLGGFEELDNGLRLSVCEAGYDSCVKDHCPLAGDSSSEGQKEQVECMVGCGFWENKSFSSASSSPTTPAATPATTTAVTAVPTADEEDERESCTLAGFWRVGGPSCDGDDFSVLEMYDRGDSTYQYYFWKHGGATVVVDWEDMTGTVSYSYSSTPVYTISVSSSPAEDFATGRSGKCGTHITFSNGFEMCKFPYCDGYWADNTNTWDE